jgi:hypothetical protein
MNAPFEITREEVLNLAAQKLVDAYGGDPDISEKAEEIIRRKVSELLSEVSIRTRIDECLTKELERLLGTEIVPVDIWGNREGKPTTIRAQLTERAKKFWEVPIDRDGRESTYGGTPRSEVLMKQLLKAEFENAVKTNAEVIVAEFKKAILADATKMVTENIDKLINTKQR